MMIENYQDTDANNDSNNDDDDDDGDDDYNYNHNAGNTATFDTFQLVMCRAKALSLHDNTLVNCARQLQNALAAGGSCYKNDQAVYDIMLHR